MLLMKKRTLLLLCIAVLCSLASAQDYPIQPVPFTSVKLTDNFWAPRIKLNHDVTIPIALFQCYNTGRVDNFLKAAGLKEGAFGTEYPFDDTDIYKILEGASYSLQTFPDKKLEAHLDALIYYISAAQEPDGYLFTNRTIKPQKLHPWVGKNRWETEADLSHELYCCGHLYEAAAAHFRATGKRNLLDVAIKNADLLVQDFGPGKLRIAPGHQIVEMGLVKLYGVTGKKEYIDLAKWFLDSRGTGSEYSQNHKPVIEQETAVGHAVRAGYMYSGMADVAALTGNKEYITAIDKIWNDVVSHKIYLTGGVGSTGGNEGYGPNYLLPNLSAYNETCAAIANVYWNLRLFLLHGDSKYYDVLERTLYNGLISGVSLSGDRFFYPNPLESQGGDARSEWFGCACCPSNICRFIPSVPGYVYAQNNDRIYINLYMSNTAQISLKTIKTEVVQKTNYPWEGEVSITVNPAKTGTFEVALRIPGWAQNRPIPSDLYRYVTLSKTPYKVSVNGQNVPVTLQNGYAVLHREWKTGDKMVLNLPMEIRQVVANEQVADDRGRTAIERGPIVYCLEWPDNQNIPIRNLLLSSKPSFTTVFEPDLLGGVQVIHTTASTLTENVKKKIEEAPVNITAIPYFAWANRGRGTMMVWIPDNKAFALPLKQPTLASQSKVTASRGTVSPQSVNDLNVPANSNDHNQTYSHFWPIRDTTLWIQYTFPAPTKVSSTRVYWFDDSPQGGGCRVPRSWKVLYLNAENQWNEVTQKGPYGVAPDKFNELGFEPITTSAVRLSVQLPQRASAGVHEWEIQ